MGYRQAKALGLDARTCQVDRHRVHDPSYLLLLPSPTAGAAREGAHARDKVQARRKHSGPRTHYMPYVHVRTARAYRHIFPVLPRVCVSSPRRGSSSSVAVARDSRLLATRLPQHPINSRTNYGRVQRSALAVVSPAVAGAVLSRPGSRL